MDVCLFQPNCKSWVQKERDKKKKDETIFPLHLLTSSSSAWGTFPLDQS